MKLDFQTIFLGLLVVAAIAAIVIFAKGGSTSKDESALIKVTMWGDVETKTGLGAAVTEFNQRNGKKYNVTYTYIKPVEFEAKLIESIADSKAPDLVLMSNSKLLRLENKLQPISYQTLPITTFNDTYIDAAKTYLSGKGSLGLPLILDPVVMYSNRDLLTNASVIDAPKYWDDLIPLQTKLTKRGDIAGTFEYSAIALGEYENITHAKDIIATLLLQAGIPIVSRNDRWEPKVSLTTETRTTGESPVDSVLRFYMDFSNPLKTLYSWNRTQPMSFDAFTGEKLAFYIGRASDYGLIKEKNPHLNFNISEVPQIKTQNNVETTYAEVLGVSTLKASKQGVNAQKAMFALAADSIFIDSWSKKAMLPPARKDLLKKAQTDQVLPYLYNAAIRSKSWLDPTENETSTIFNNVITGMSSGRFQTPSIATGFMNQELDSIIRKLPQ